MPGTRSAPLLNPDLKCIHLYNIKLTLFRPTFYLFGKQGYGRSM